MQDIILNKSKLKKWRKKNENDQEYQTVLGINQKIRLEGKVINRWKIREELEGICTVRFEYKGASKMNAMASGFSCYQVQRGANGNAILVRLSK